MTLFMSHHFNLAGDKYFPRCATIERFVPPLVRKLFAVMRRCLPVWTLILFLSTFGGHSRKHSLLDDWAQLETFQKIRNASTDFHDHDSDISQLRKNFLSNTKIKDEILQEEFRESGLSHLLALSGGQTAPAAMFICNSILVIICILLRGLCPHLNANSIIGKIRILTLLIKTSALTFLVGLYQSTGALSRTLATQVSMSARSANTLISRDSRPVGARWIRTLFICSPWILSWLWHQNPVRDLSFVLSLMGGLTASLIDQLVGLIIHNFKTEKSEEMSSKKILPLWNIKPLSALSRWILATSLTSTCMSFMTLPLWPSGELLDKILANLLAGPCVLLLVTPASLFVCLGIVTQTEWITLVAQKALGFALVILRDIARCFSNHPVDAPRALTDSLSVTLWTSVPVPPLLILSVEIALLYFCVEAIRERRREV
jgi:hypothetical protein